MGGGGEKEAEEEDSSDGGEGSGGGKKIAIKHAKLLVVGLQLWFQPHNEPSEQ